MRLTYRMCPKFKTHDFQENEIWKKGLGSASLLLAAAELLDCCCGRIIFLFNVLGQFPASHAISCSPPCSSHLPTF